MNEILIYDIVGQDYFGAGVIAKDVKQQLDSFGAVDEITVRINSPGGDVFEGLAIYNLLAEHPAKITVKVDGYAASIASIIAMAGDEILMADNAMLMIHNPYTFAIGDAKEMRQQADVLDKVKDSLIKTYQAKADIDDETLSELMDAETWMDAGESITRGFATGKAGSKGKLSNVSSFRWINKAPAVPSEPEITRPAPEVFEFDGMERSNKLAALRHEIALARLALR